jgi:hypothetical protein
LNSLDAASIGAGRGRGNAHRTRFRRGVHQSFPHALGTGSDRAGRGIHDAVVRCCRDFHDCAHSTTAGRPRGGDPGSWSRSLALRDRASNSMSDQQDRSPASMGNCQNGPDTFRQRPILYFRNPVDARFTGKIVLTSPGLCFFSPRRHREHVGFVGGNPAVSPRQCPTGPPAGGRETQRPGISCRP